MESEEKAKRKLKKLSEETKQKIKRLIKKELPKDWILKDIKLGKQHVKVKQFYGYTISLRHRIIGDLEGKIYIRWKAEKEFEIVGLKSLSESLGLILKRTKQKFVEAL